MGGRLASDCGGTRCPAALGVFQVTQLIPDRYRYSPATGDVVGEFCGSCKRGIT